jgi:hypothetical protein
MHVRNLCLYGWFLCLLPACIVDDKKIAMESLIVQVPLDSAIITKLQTSLKPVIENIIQQELAAYTLDKDVPPFFFKKRQAITIYYLNDFDVEGRVDLYTHIDALVKNSSPKAASLTSNLAFFGEDAMGERALTDLVVMIDDPNKELFALNAAMKSSMHKLNEDYKKTHKNSLYDIAKSERFAYKPHLSLGHLRANYIKALIPDKDLAEQTLVRIKQRILDSVTAELQKLFLTESNVLSMHGINVYDLKTRDYIKRADFAYKFHE